MNILSVHPDYNQITFSNNSITYNGETINLDDIDIEKMLQENPHFIEDIPTLSIESVYKIIKVHVTFMKQEKKNEEKKEVINELAEITPLLKKIHFFTKKENDGTVKKYVHFTDKDGIDHVLFNLSEDDILRIYQSLQETMGINMTEEDLFETLEAESIRLQMESLYEAEKRTDASEEHLNNLRNIEDYNAKTLTFPTKALGNEEHQIYLRNEDILTIKQNANGETVQEKHEIVESKDDDLNDEVAYNVDVTPLITFDEYADLILNREFVNDDEMSKIRNYESFLFDVITYKEYLTEDLYNVYLRYTALSEQIYAIQNPNTAIAETKKRYEDMLDRSQNVTLTHVDEKVMKLTRMNPDTNKAAGFASALFYIGITIVLGILLALTLM